jgi:hypothetical protein
VVSSQEAEALEERVAVSDRRYRSRPQTAPGQ